MTAAQTDPRARSAFAPETVFDTDEGPLPVEWLRPGHRIRTRDGGFQEVVRVEAAEGAGPAVAVPADAIEEGVPRASLKVGPGHLFLIRHPAVEFYFGAPAVFVEASDLVGINGIARAKPGQTLLRVALAEASVVVSEGLGSAVVGPEGAIPAHPVLHEGDALVLREALRREWQALRQSA